MELDRATLRRLEILECPINEAWTFDLLQIGIAWLEEEKLRLLPLELRQWQTQISDLPAWTNEFRKYCEKADVKIPSGPLTIEILTSAFKALIARAIEELFADAAREASPKEVEATEKVFEKALVGPETLKLVDEMCRPKEVSRPPEASGQWNKGRPGQPTPKAADCPTEVAFKRVLPDPSPLDALLVLSSRLRPKPTEQLRPADGLDQKEKARIVANKKIQHLQTCINQILAQLQTVTADPKTDHRLGKVGF